MIRFELEHIKQSVLAAFVQSKFEVQQLIENAVKLYCTPENLESVINATAKLEIDKAIQEEIRTFFQRGEGRKVIAELVKEKLLKDIDLI